MSTSFEWTETVQFVVIKCPTCDISFGITSSFNERCNVEREKKSYFCPNGHSMYRLGESYEKKIARLEAEKIALQSRVRSVDDQRLKAERKTERMKKRVKAGTCPFCKRTFKQLAAHMACKHADEPKN